MKAVLVVLFFLWLTVLDIESGTNKNKGKSLASLNPLTRAKEKKDEKAKKEGGEDQDVTLQAFKATEPDEPGMFQKFRDKLERICYKQIGCFTARDYQDSSSRPIPILPMSPDAINPIFYLYTPEDRTYGRNFTYNVTEEDFKNTTYNPKLRTAFIIHGFQSGYAPWMTMLKDFIFLASNDGFNVFCVDWAKGSKVTSYNLAAANTRIVGALVALIIDRITRTYNIKNDMFYLIGHSLGAHTCGYAGKRLYDPKLARITGLDPAGVGFHFNSTVSHLFRLHPTDATTVDAIHTDAALHYTEGFGTEETLAYYDFYPNGGSWQPGCARSTGVFEKITSITSGGDITCSHSRACQLFADLNKVEDDCYAIGYQCESYLLFLEGRCAECADRKCMLMGVDPQYWKDHVPNNKTSNFKYYLNTAPQEDFCLHHYQFAFHISKGSDLVTGEMFLTFNSSFETKYGTETKTVNISKVISKTTQDHIHTMLITFDFKLKNVKKVYLEWNRWNNTIYPRRPNKGMTLRIPNIEINYMSHYNESIRTQNSMILCPKYNGVHDRISANKTRMEYSSCKPNLKQNAHKLSPHQLQPITAREDIFSLHYLSYMYPIYHKIEKTNFDKGLLG